MISTIIFDFDGVIVESVDIKAQAFCHVFRQRPPEIRRQILELHMNQAGTPRRDKFRIIYKEFLNQPVSAVELEQLSVEFSQFCVDKIVAAPYVTGAFEFISQYHGTYDMFIVSSAPESELKEIVNRRGIDGFFKGIFGTPRGKLEICHAILKQKQLLPQQVAFIGDSISDYQVARQCGTRFIGRIDEKSQDPLCQEPLRLKLHDLSHLNDMLLTVLDQEEVSP
jgi:phosphoglycolate phosphatase-like HAD superfamily hydrolase